MRAGIAEPAWVINRSGESAGQRLTPGVVRERGDGRGVGLFTSFWTGVGVYASPFPVKFDTLIHPYGL